MFRIVGIILMLAGVAGMAWGGWDYFTDRNSVEINGTELRVEDRKMPVQGLLGLGSFAVGTALVLVTKPKR